MSCIRMLLVGLIAAASIAAADEPPPFGTVLQSWELQMGGSYEGAGITWHRDSGLLYLMGQGSSVYKLRPDDPTGTIRRDTWVFANLGTGTADIPWGIAWDSDSGCFWISQIVDGNVYGDCYLLRMTWSDSAWRWRGTPADSWRMPDMYWSAGMAKRLERGYFIGAMAAPVSGLFKFDPYTKTILGTIGQIPGCRVVALVPADSYYIITHDTISLMKLDSAGQLLQRESPGRLGAADMEVVTPSHPGPDDTVFLYSIYSSTNNTLQKISTGMLWGQLRAGGAIAEPGWPVSAADGRLRIEPNPIHGSATIRLSSLLPPRYSLSLCDASGRLVFKSPIAIRQSPFALDLRSVPVGIYFLQVETEGRTQTAKLIVER
jgi:hypothetical protein